MRSPNSVAASATEGRQRWIDIAKGVAIVAVVAYHTLLFLSSADVGVADFGRIRPVLEYFPMPAFFLLAGLLQPRMMQSTFVQLWKRRLLPFAYLYLLWCVIRFLFFTAFPFVRSDGELTSGRDPLTLLIAPIVPSSVYWFLWSMFVITLVTWLLRRVPGMVLVVVTGIISALFSSTLVSTGMFAYDRSLQYMFFFVCGVVLSPRITAFVHARRWPGTVALLAGYVAVGALVLLVPVTRKIPGLATLGQICILLGLFSLFRLLSRAPGARFVGMLGQQSLIIYVLHIYFVAAAVVIVRNVPALHDVAPRGLPVLAVTVAVVIAASLLLGMVAAPLRWLFLPPAWLMGQRRRRRPVRASDADDHDLTDPERSHTDARPAP